jgi:low temperature requirement protein LtrA
MAAGNLVQAPRLWPAHTRDQRRVTWIELFFDLIFVAAVAQVGIPLASDYSWSGLLRYAFLFVLIWWAWSGHTLFVTRFDSDDLFQRVLVLIQCFLAAVMAANAKDGLDSRSSAGFGAAYAGIRIILVIQYLRAQRIHETSALARRYAAGFGIAAFVWVASALVDAPIRYVLWTTALCIDFVTPWLAEVHAVNAPPDSGHFPERFGLFTIILLGEFVAAVMRGIASQEYWTFSAASTAFTGMAFAFTVRWWYFDRARGASERHIRTPRQARLFRVWEYAHLPAFLGIAVAGVGFQRAISLPSGAHLNLSDGWILCSAVALIMAAVATIGGTSSSAHVHRRHLLPQYAIALGVALLGAHAASMHRVIVVALLLAACVAQALLSRPNERKPIRKAEQTAPHQLTIPGINDPAEFIYARAERQ